MRMKRSLKAFNVYLLAHCGDCVLLRDFSSGCPAHIWFWGETVRLNTGKFVRVTALLISEWAKCVYQHVWALRAAKWLRDAMETVNKLGPAVSQRKLSRGASVLALGLSEPTGISILLEVPLAEVISSLHILISGTLKVNNSHERGKWGNNSDQRARRACMVLLWNSCCTRNSTLGLLLKIKTSGV